MTRRLTPAVIVFVVSFPGLGCAPRAFVDGVAWMTRTSGTRNAASQPVRGRPDLRLNAAVLDQLDHVSADADLTSARETMRRTIEQANRLARYAVNNEFDRIPDTALRQLWRRYYRGEPQPASLRETLRSRYWTAADERYAELGKQIDAAESVDELRTLASSIRRAVHPSPKDRHGHGLFLDLVSALIHDDAEPPDRGGRIVDVYEPGGQAVLCRAATGEAGSLEARLLARYAPIIVQERLADPPYEPDIDRIGTVRLDGAPTQSRVRIDTSTPSVYAYWQYTLIHNRRHIQLTYTHWFRRHPKLKPFDAEAGDIEGATFRITLDAELQPAIVETVLNCGCYHRGYPSEELEQQACEDYGRPLDGKRFCIEQHRPDKIDWIIPKTIAMYSPDAARPVLYSRAGYHGVGDVSFDASEIQQRTVRHRFRYRLRCYDELERLPIKGAFASMFGPDGLVRGAARLEGLLLAPTGMLSAGQPRQRGTQLLHWDQYDFDDPHLLETCLRLPSGL